MVAHLLEEERISLTDLAKRENVSTATIWRWCNKGTKGVHLEAFSIGGRRYTTQEAWVRFIEARSATAMGPSAPVSSPVSREKAIKTAEAELAEAGV